MEVGEQLHGQKNHTPGTPIFSPSSVSSPLSQGEKEKKKIPRTRSVALGAKEARKRSLFLKQAKLTLVA